MIASRLIPLIFLMPLAAVAEPLGRPSAAAAPAVSSPVGGLVQMTFGLIFVVALIFLFAWVMRRYMRLQYAATGGLKILGGVPMGVRERLVLVQVGEKQLLLGVTPNTISTLHVLDQPVSVDQPVGLEGAFADRLAGILKGLKAGKSR